MPRKRLHLPRLSFLIVSVCVLVGGGFVAIASASAEDQSVLVAVVGDIQCGADSPTGDDRCESQQVHSLIAEHHPNLVLMPGDLQYETGAPEDFAAEFGPTWSDMTSLIRPAPGNHEYRDKVAGYLGYFGDSVTTEGQLFYGFGAGPWQGLSLDSNCAEMDCSAAGSQMTWASQQLAAWNTVDPGGCSIVEYHHPVLTAYTKDSEPAFADTFAMLASQGVDIVVAGHVHAYERFAPVDATLAPAESGTVQFTVGTGGKSHYQGSKRPDTTPAFSTGGSFGVLFLTLNKGAYTFEFIDIDGNVLDKGAGTCH